MVERQLVSLTNSAQHNLASVDLLPSDGCCLFLLSSVQKVPTRRFNDCLLPILRPNDWATKKLPSCSVARCLAYSEAGIRTEFVSLSPFLSLFLSLTLSLLSIAKNRYCDILTCGAYAPSHLSKTVEFKCFTILRESPKNENRSHHITVVHKTDTDLTEE